MQASILQFFEPEDKSVENGRCMYEIFNTSFSIAVLAHLEKEEKILVDRNLQFKSKLRDSHYPSLYSGPSL